MASHRQRTYLGQDPTMLRIWRITPRRGLDNASKNTPQESSTPKPTPQFPAGSYSFRADLQNISTDCTSNPSTWRCYPYTQGSSATFFWIITTNDDNSYNISSTTNPFAPSFSNLTLKRLDENTSKERLQFSFSMTKTVVPDAMLSSSNRAAKCMFDNTLFEATLWTQRNDGSDDGSGGDKFADWPGDVEIVQRKMFRGGSPECLDSQGSNVGDIKASNGTCECRYAN
ncbi:tat pathway signal sequence [Fusarium flagelliforme]|uniref:Tat pathway signal sequence n=1 Tax=Fusarium flagelliforme TaxID=2675880 RepID=A0A395M6S1_9HYPO|nr:tat pathway signal sequence [Fusarium flagelliforme]